RWPWPRHVGRGRALDRPYALEGAFAEAPSTAGPALAVVLAGEVSPPLGLIVALVMTAIASIGMIRLPELARHGPSTATPDSTSLLRKPTILLMAGTGIGMGIVFGSIEISLVAFAEEMGSEGMASVDRKSTRLNSSHVKSSY